MVDATIRDVARRAQVSVASVSRVLNGFEKVSEQTRERVMEAVTALSYVPHAAARSLSMARTHSIGVVLPDLHGEFFSEIVRGMDRVASERGYLLLLSSLHTGNTVGTSPLRALRGRVDGALVMAPHLTDEELSEVLPRGFEVVLLNTRSGSNGRPVIMIDNASGAKAVAEHFVALGRKRIVHISGPANNADASERADAFKTALASPYDVLLETVQGDFSEQSGGDSVAALLQTGRPFDAVFAANDNMAIGALQALRRAGLRVPADVAVAGFDDTPIARHLGLTTVRVHIAALGGLGLTALLDMIEGHGQPADILHPVELVIRSTTSEPS